MTMKIATANNDAQYETAVWYRHMLNTNNEKFMPLLFDTHRYLVLKGGGGSGKSIFAGRKILERATSEPGHRILVCRKVARTIRESCFKQLLGQLAEHYPDIGYKANKSDMVITFDNGNEIIFAGLDDVEKLKSIYNITAIWIEEASELAKEDFYQLDIRLRGESRFYQQIILSFNPVSIKHWLKELFFDKNDPLARTHESTYRDNRFLPEKDRQTLERFKDTDEYHYTVYCLGMWGVTGSTVFNAKDVTRRLTDGVLPVKTGYFIYSDDGLRLADIRWIDDAAGFIRIYAEPVKGIPYVIGADTAGTGGDRYCAQVLDNRTGAQAATLHRKNFDEDVFAKQLYCLGMYYNAALVGIETNYSTYPVRELERLRYPRQYVRETVDDFTHGIVRSYGFRTDSKTRPVIIAGLIQAARDDINIVCDKTTLEEMLTFVRGDDWRPEAEAGAHDDCIMALAIAHYIRPQQTYLGETQPGNTVEWHESMWEDYNRASSEERDVLRKMWGNPKTRR